MSFSELQLTEPVLKALRHEGYHAPTPIQQQAIPVILQNKDLLGCAQTGTGKTAAFVLPLLQLIDAHRTLHKQNTFSALILSPTRELAIQIGESITAYGRYLDLKHAVVYGGVPQHSQVQAIRRGVDIIVATPGRLMDLAKQNHIQFRDIRYLVLDEADRMLDMGFIHDVQRIIARLPEKRQTLFFSATMPGEIRSLAARMLKNPVHIEVERVSSVVEMIDQHVYFVAKQNKQSLLIHLLNTENIGSLLVFTQMKHAADRLCRQLKQAGIRAEAIHGNKSQSQRQTALNNFKNKRVQVLVATDIAARGLDIDNVSHVINFELPKDGETYVHRIGRTGRAGLSGVAMSFCDWSEKVMLVDIQKLIKKTIPVVKDHIFDVTEMHAKTHVANSSTAVSAPPLKRMTRSRGARTFSQHR